MNITVNGPQILWVLFPDSLHITITQTTLTSWIVMAILITAASSSAAACRCVIRAVSRSWWKRAL